MWSTGPEKAKEAQCALAARRRAACFSLSLSSALGRACLPCRPYTLREAVPPGSGAGPRQLLASARFAAVWRQFGGTFVRGRATPRGAREGEERLAVSRFS